MSYSIRRNLGQLTEKKSKAITSADSPYSVAATDEIILVDASGGAVTITLPTAVIGQAGKIYTIKRVDNVASDVLVTIATTSSQTIDGATNQYLWNAENITVQSDNANWTVLQRSQPETMYSFMLKGSTANRRYVATHQGQYSGTPITSTTSPAINVLWAEPFFVPKTTKFDTISFNITTAAAVSQARAGIYRDTGNCYPGALYFDTGAIATTTTGLKDTTITSNLQLFPAGLYWLAWECDTTGLQIISISGAGNLDMILGFSNVMTAAGGYAYSVAHTFGALPSPYTSGATILTTAPAATNPVPAIGLRPV